MSAPESPEPEERPGPRIEISPEAAAKLQKSIDSVSEALAPKMLPGLEKLIASQRALERATAPPNFFNRINTLRHPLPLPPLPATRDDVAAVTEAVIELHGAVIDQSKFQIEQSKRQDRMDRRFFWLELTLGALTVALTIAAIVVAIYA